MTSAAVALRRTVAPVAAAVGLGYVAAAGFLVVRRPHAGVAVAALPFVVLLLAYPAVAFGAAVALLPMQRDIPGTAGFGGLHIAMSDVLTALTVIGLIPPILVDRAWRDRIRDAVPALRWIAPFALWLVVVVLAHFSKNSLFNAVQYLELTGLALVLPVVAFDRRFAKWAVTGFVAVGCVTAVMWIANVGLTASDNKNPSGQFMVDAALLSLIVIRRWAIKAPVFLLLIVGTLFSESRGAIVGFVIGGIVLFAARGRQNPGRAIASVIPIAMLMLVGYSFVPASVQNRVTSTLSSTHVPGNAIVNNSVNGSLSSAQYTAQLRVLYRREGIDLVKQHPVTGLGLGNYQTGDLADGSLTGDPHDVLLLDAGEGGIPDMLLYVVMIVGPMVLVARRLRKSPWAGPALAVQAAIVAHGLFDVYWVRGTPMVGWILIGMALSPRLDYLPDDSTAVSTGPAEQPAISI